MPDLTARQQQVLDCIKRHIAERGYPPTFREIGAEMGIRSPNGVKQHMVALVRKGAVEVEYAKARGIRVLGVKVCPLCGSVKE